MQLVFSIGPKQIFRCDRLGSQDQRTPQQPHLQIALHTHAIRCRILIDDHIAKPAAHKPAVAQHAIFLDPKRSIAPWDGRLKAATRISTQIQSSVWNAWPGNRFCFRRSLRCTPCAGQVPPISKGRVILAHQTGGGRHDRSPAPCAQPRRQPPIIAMT